MKRTLYVCVICMLMSLFCMMQSHESVQAASKTKQEVYKEITKHFLNRDKSFDISGASRALAKKITNRLNSSSDAKYYSILFEITQAYDDKKTTDDEDYIYGNLREVYCYNTGGKLRFYDVKYFESKKQTKKVNTYVNKVAKKIMKKESSKINRIKLAYQYVIQRVTYDSRKNCYFSAYAGFVKRKTVCNGYALMLYKILMKMNIPCKFISGSLKDGKKWYLHAWNIVKYQGRWYNLDACSDDGDDGEVYGDYFMKTKKEFSSDHKKDFFYRTKSFQAKYNMI